MAKRDYDLRIEEEERLEPIVQALSAAVRRRIMCILRGACYSIAELAKLLKLPISTVAFHINILRKAGLISVTVKKNSRGNAKLIARQVDRISIDFSTDYPYKKREQFMQEIPLGSFVDAHVEAGCGMANERGMIVAYDLPGAFFSPERYDAQIVWFTKGYLEYRIPNYMLKDRKCKAVVLSMELCSEAPNYRNDWESDITFWVNGVELATYLSPGDFGGRRGRLNPAWWSDYSTQYGIIKTLRITPECTYLDETVVGYQTIDKLKLIENEYFTFRIGVKENARHQGGLNLFGEKFGDFAQGLVYQVDYE
ncbi:MAG: helix-turn-helix domain-containing protein [Clostridia bacterium]|jgi:predicted transcriptional regulator|nr:helix-turn-helix domain-containing protein [Clostridia bacterium]